VVFAIVLLLGVGVLVIGIGGYLFVSDVQVASAPVQTVVAMSDQAPADPVAEDLAPAPAVDRPPLSIEITADQKILVGGEEVPFDKLPEKLRSGIQKGASPQVILTQTGSGDDVHQKVFELLSEMEISFQIKDE
jgi:biopolymer transport protein ExbD